MFTRVLRYIIFEVNKREHKTTNNKQPIEADQTNVGHFCEQEGPNFEHSSCMCSCVAVSAFRNQSGIIAIQMKVYR